MVGAMDTEYAEEHRKTVKKSAKICVIRAQFALFAPSKVKCGLTFLVALSLPDKPSIRDFQRLF
jgi:hypothetical protein